MVNLKKYLKANMKKGKTNQTFFKPYNPIVLSENTNIKIFCDNDKQGCKWLFAMYITKHFCINEKK